MKQAKDFTNELRPIIDLMKEDANGAAFTKCYPMYFNFYIESPVNELMIRLNTYNQTLVIARVVFNHKRQGYMTKLHQLLEEFAKKYDFKKIEIECILTEGMKQFALKNGFEQEKLMNTLTNNYSQFVK